jgi:hypothetical protein
MTIRLVLICATLLVIGCGGGGNSSTDGSSSQSISTPNIAGNWTFTATSSKFGGQVNAIGTIAQNGSTITGSLALSGSACASAGSFSGTISGNSLTISLNENGQTVTFTGTVSGSSASGSYSAPAGGCTNGDMGTWAGTETSNPAGSISPASLTFTNQNTNTSSAPQVVTLSDPGTANLAIMQISVSGDFSESNNCGLLIGTGASCAIQVTFTPTAVGTRNGTLTIQDNAANSPQTVSLAGTGTASIPGTPTGSTTVTITGTGSDGKTSQLPITVTVH